MLLAIVVLFSTMSFTVDKHYCGTILVDIAINSQVQKCGMQMPSAEQDDSCPESTQLKNSCCKDEHVFLKGQDELQKHFESSLDFPVVLVNTFHNYALPCFELEDRTVLSLAIHDPPDLDIDFQVLYETYLI